MTPYLARFSPADRNLDQKVNGGLAIDRDQGRLYIADTKNSAIRALDLASDKVPKVLSHGPEVEERDARKSLVSEDLEALSVLRDHSLVFVDRGFNVVRRVQLQLVP